MRSLPRRAYAVQTSYESRTREALLLKSYSVGPHFGQLQASGFAVKTSGDFAPFGPTLFMSRLRGGAPRRPDVLDPALLRPGRCGRASYVQNAIVFAMSVQPVMMARWLTLVNPTRRLDRKIEIPLPNMAARIEVRRAAWGKSRAPR